MIMLFRQTRLILVAFILCSYLSYEALGSSTNKGKGGGSRIHKGHEVKPHSIPWQVQLRFVKKGTAYFACGGSILSKNWVITASHCLNGREKFKWKILAGLHSNRGKYDTYVHTYDVEKFIRHPKYKKAPKNLPHPWDVALMKVKKEIKFNEKIAPICLPKLDDEKKIKKNGTHLVASGWGKFERGDKALADFTWKLADKLQEVVLPWYPGCWLATMPEGTPFKPYYAADYHLCAGGKLAIGKTVCDGDSGGPLGWYDSTGSNKYKLAGVISFAELTCDDSVDFPVVSAKVTSKGILVDFIQKHVKDVDDTVKKICGKPTIELPPKPPGRK